RGAGERFPAGGRSQRAAARSTPTARRTGGGRAAWRPGRARRPAHRRRSPTRRRSAAGEPFAGCVWGVWLTARGAVPPGGVHPFSPRGENSTTIQIKVQELMTDLILIL